MQTLQSLPYVLLLSICLFILPASAQVVISEVYGGGGNSGSIWKQDFIELYNRADSSILLDGWSVQYLSATGTGVWKATSLSGSIAAHGFYLIQEDSGSGGTTNLPAPDAVGTIGIASSSGKIAVCSSANALAGANPGDSCILDLVGFGSSANYFEGSGPAPAPSNTRSIERKASSSSTVETMGEGGAEEFLGNGNDSNENSTDFFTRTPQPQNSTSPAESPLADFIPPRVDSIAVSSAEQIRVYFNEAVDSLDASQCEHYLMNNGVSVTYARRDPANQCCVTLTITAISNDVYILTIQNVKDISGNEMNTPAVFSFTFGVLSIANARTAEIGTTVRVRGIITAVFESASLSFLQDSTAGIAVLNSGFAASIDTGDLWEIAGVLKNYNGLLCIDPLFESLCAGTGNSLPLPKRITAEQIGEEYESQILRIAGVHFTESGIFTGGISGTTYHMTDGIVRVDVRISAGSPLEGCAIPAGIINLKGVLSQYFSRYQLLPRNALDIELLSGPQFASPPFVSSLTDTSFTVDWITREPGYSSVAFGITPVPDDSIAASGSLPANVHSVTIAGRSPGRLYYFRASTTNGSGTSFSAVYPVVTTSSQSTGRIEVYFNYPVDESLGLQPAAHGSTDLLAKLLERISHAGRSIDIALYSFDDFSGMDDTAAYRAADSLISAKARGVSIRMVYDDKQTSVPLQRLIDAGVSVQKRNLIGNNGIMHNKMFIFDGRDTIDAEDDWVMNGSWNVTNYGTIDDAQNAVFIQDQSLARIYTIEFEEMFGSSEETANPGKARFGSTKLDNTPHFTFVDGKKIEVYFSPTDQTSLRIVDALATANSDVFFALLSFTRTDICGRLIACKNSGVAVHGIIDQEPSVLALLQSAGIDALEAGHPVVRGYMHHKYAVVDPFDSASDPLIITGSHNWSTNAETDNDENTIVIHSGETAREYVQEFSARYKESGGTGVLVGVDGVSGILPDRSELYQNYPNPFNPRTMIRYVLGVKSEVSLKVFDMLGREIAALTSGIQSAGEHSVEWNGKNSTGQQAASGVYFYRIRAGSFIDTKKLILLR